MSYLGDFATGVVVRVPWATTGADGSSITRATDGTIRIYKDNSVTQRTSSAGITDTEDFDALTGVHYLNIDLSDNTDAGFYAAAHDYWVVLVGAVIDGKTVNTVLGQFSIQNRYNSAGPTAAAIRAEIDSNSTQLAAIVSYIDTEVAAILAAVDTEIAAIKAKTDNLPSDPADASDIAALIAALPTTAQIADKLLGRNIAGSSDGGRTVKDALRALRNKVTDVSGTLTVYQEDDATSAWTAVSTRDSTAGALTGVDPA